MVVYLLLAVLPFLRVRKPAHEWWAELREANAAGALLSTFIFLMVAFAMFISLRLLFL
jgi:hypothetical protein